MHQKVSTLYDELHMPLLFCLGFDTFNLYLNYKIL